MLILAPIVLLLLPADFFDHGRSICLSKVFFDMSCLGCGITRAIQHLLHLDFEIAFSYNKLSVVVLPILMAVWVQYTIKTFRKIRQS
ncbi:MAG: DUF2752 domain-containing protein [bacterium]|nr:DUF2752 domain-containing protein [bacterium]